MNLRKYEFIIGSPNEYDNLVVFIWYNGEQIAIVQQEEGKNKMMIDFFEEPINNKIYLTDFIDALKEAEKLLLNCN